MNRRPSGERRDEILTVAAEAFSERGTRGVSLAQIAQRIGISEPGLLHHFRSKSELLSAVLRHRDEEDRKILSDAFAHAADTPEALLTLCRHHRDHPTSIRLFTITAAESLDDRHSAHGYFRDRYRDVRAEIAGWVAADQEAGRLSKDLTPEALAAEIASVMDGLQIQWLLDPSFDMCGAFRAYLSRLRP